MDEGFFFFKQKTAYEIYQCDWSSDVCSSDLEFKNAIVIPSMSLNKTKEGYKVFIVGEGDTARSRPVEVAYVTTDYTVIKSGVYEGELVVTDTPQELKDGMPVKVIDVQEAATGKQKD